VTALDGVDLLVALDDTDDLHSPGTGRRCRGLMEALEAAGLGTPAGATRHQLLVDDRIPYTSHNSSACIHWRLTGSAADVIALAGPFLVEHSAAAADPGLAVVDPRHVDREALVAFGRSAQTSVLTQDAAQDLAGRTGVHLSGHGGTDGGVIGALAAVGLALSGSDGLFLSMPGIRDLGGACTYAELRALVPIDLARGPDGAEPAAGDRLELGDWVRPVLLDGLAVLLLQPPVDGVWAVQPRAVVKRY
jgi:hypothetical protein